MASADAYVDRYGNVVEPNPTVTNPDGSVTATYPNGSTSTINPDGTTSSIGADGVKRETRYVSDPVSGKNVLLGYIIGTDGTAKVDYSSPDTRAAYEKQANDALSGGPQSSILPSAGVTYKTDNTGGPSLSGVLGGVLNPLAPILHGDATFQHTGGHGASYLDTTGKKLADATGGIGGSGGSGGAADLTGAIAASSALRDKFTSAYDNFTPGTAPVITASQAQAPSLATYLAQQPIERGTAGQVGAVQQVIAPTIDMANAPRSVAGTAVAGTATAAQAQAYLAQAAQAQAYDATAAQAQAYQAKADQAKASLATASQLDPTQQAEFRAQQQTLTGYLNDAILGKGPSVAELQLREAEQRQEANQLGLAAAASRGGNSALAMRTAANNIARLNQNSSAEQALLRAKEIADARSQLGAVANEGRTGDLNLADRNATLTTDVSKTNAGLLTGVSQSNAGLNTDVSKTNASLATGVSQSNAGLLTDVSNANAGRRTSVSQSNAGLVTDTNNANAGRLTGVSQSNAGLQTDVSKTNANNQTSASQTNATNQTSSSNTNANNLTSLLAKQADLQYQASHDNAGNALSAQETQAHLDTDTSLAAALAQNTANLQTQRLSEESSATNATNSTNTNINNAKFLNDASTNNATNTITQRQLDEKTRQDAASNAQNASATTVSGSSAAADNATKQDELSWKKKTGVVGAFGSAFMALSDRRAKTDVSDGGGDAQDLLDALTAKSFRYKDGGKSPGERPGRLTGVMAQDIEKTKAGKPLVVNTPRGKAIDSVPATGTLMAMLATMNKRLDRVEGRHHV